MPAAERLATGFAPVARRDARLLILGSMPGQVSLAAQQYYAHPRNAFWPLMEALAGIPVTLPYRSRLAGIRRCGIALWDVLQTCERPGSLDADIQLHTAQPNDFHRFFERYRAIRRVICNGQAAARLYRRRVVPTLPDRTAELEVLVMPSTSPAMAAMNFAQKRKVWSTIVDDLL